MSEEEKRRHWAMFAASCLANGETRTDDAADQADELLVEMEKRFPDSVQS